MGSEIVNEVGCQVCMETNVRRYQCCSNDSDGCCELCWTKIVSQLIESGQIVSVLMDSWRCQSCHDLIRRDALPEVSRNRINAITSTIPKKKSPTKIEDFNYSYDDHGVLRQRDTDEKFIFLTQRHYNLLGNCIDRYIQSKMKADPWNYTELWLPIKVDESDDHHDQVNIFHSSDFTTNENGCLILIQGSGAVRPGQWARSCCINECLDIGSMFPYMTKAKEHNLSVIILNPNQTSYEEQDQNDTTTNVVDTDEDPIDFYLSSNPLPRLQQKKIPELSTSREHILYVYDHIISKLCPAKNLYVVAHSAGGDGFMFLFRKRQNEILAKLHKVAFTDSVHSLLPFEPVPIKSFLHEHAIHFVASDQPMGEPITDRYYFAEESACQEVSAGHRKHEYTSGHCVDGVFQFFFNPHPFKNNDKESTAF